MEEKQNTPSVIARLMGIDKKKPFQQTQHRPHKVLSDEYLLKTSYISVLGKRSQFNSPNAKKHEKHLNNSEVFCTERRNIWSVCDEKESSKAGRFEFGLAWKRCMYAKSVSENQSRYPQPYISANKFVKLNAQESDVEPYCLSTCGDDVFKKLKIITSDNTTMRSLKFENHGSLRSWSISRTKMKQSSSELSKRLMNSTTSTYDCAKVHQISHGLILGMEAEKKKFEPRKGKNVEEGEGYDAGARARGRIKRSYPTLGKLQRLVGPSGINRKNGLKFKYSQKTLRPNLSLIASRSHHFQTGPDDPVRFERGSPSPSLQCSDNRQINALDLGPTNWVDHKEITTSYEDGSSETARGTFLEKDGSSDVRRHLTSKIASCESKVGWISKCKYDPDSSVISSDANQPTPDSVLEPPFREDASPISDLRGLEMKLQLLDSVMDVSSDEEDAEMASENSGNVWEMIIPEESRDFSYLVDVLDEADDINSYQLRHTNELAMDISVFESLEKKYGKQTSWQKSDRRLLFDRVNSLLSMIRNSFSCFNIEAVPLKSRFRPVLRRSEIADELWSLLVVQGTEVGKDLDVKALAKDMKWLELEEDVTSICIEIEQLLFRELVAELVRYCS